MFKVYAQHEGMDPVYLCEVGSLKEADAVINVLERAWSVWQFGDFSGELEDPRIAQMEGSGIYAESTDGSIWVEMSPGEWIKEVL